jgi:SAM-dependent methyltransferase
MDLGSGDGRTVIAAAKRGATGIGVEFNPDMVELSKRRAEEAGVTNKVSFIKGDLFEADLTKATVLTMFLLPRINVQLRPKILDLKPGTRVVSNSFTMEDWEADDTVTVTENCTSWCTALLWIVPAKVDGTWSSPQGDIQLEQKFQMVSGTFQGKPITEGRLRGDQLTLTVGTTKHTAKVNGTTLQGNGWTATKKG